VFESLQASALAQAIGTSRMLLATLSGLHLVGFTLVMGGALVSNLRLAGVVLTTSSARDVARAATRIVLGGLAVSLCTGLLLFSTRAPEAVANPIFRLKMALLLAAVVVHFVALPRAARRERGAILVTRSTGVVGLLLWIGLALAACAFILIE
jgi:hypothetical protein